MRTPRIIGLTGGIACGKSTVAAMLRERGALVVDADEIARAVVEPGTPALAAIVDAFGPSMLTPEGRLDRPRVGARVFADPEARARLQAITHPAIAAESLTRLAAAVALSPPLVVYDAALLIESGRAEQFRPLVVVTAPESAQRARLAARDRLAPDEVAARIGAQMPVEMKARLADHLIDNGGSREETARQVDALWSLLTEEVPHEG